MAFTKSVERTYTVDGAQVRVCFKRMSRVDALAVAPFMEMLSDGGIKVKFKDNLDFIDASAGVIANCVTSVSGIVIDGQEVGVNHPDWKSEVLGGVYYIAFLRDLMADIMACSFVGGEDAKKREPVQPGASTA